MEPVGSVHAPTCATPVRFAVPKQNFASPDGGREELALGQLEPFLNVVGLYIGNSSALVGKERSLQAGISHAFLWVGWVEQRNQVLERTRVRNLSQKSGKGFRAKTVGPSFSPVAIAAARTTPLLPPFSTIGQFLLGRSEQGPIRRTLFTHLLRFNLNPSPKPLIQPNRTGITFCYAIAFIVDYIRSTDHSVLDHPQTHHPNGTVIVSQITKVFFSIYLDKTSPFIDSRIMSPNQ